MSVKHLFFLIFLSHCTSDRQDYGPYDLALNGIERCHGPKSKTLAIYDFKQKDTHTVSYNITLLEQSQIDQIRLTVFSLKDNRKSMLWSHRVDKPCDQFTLAAIVENKFNAKNCVVKKGSYYFVSNYLEYINEFFGMSFFYGSYEIKALVLSLKGNIMCINIGVVFTKK